jgi:hypothetical protein
MALANSKSVLAKLLAQENITVEHRKTQTAYFDPKNRVLVLPIWKDMSHDLYDLLVGHEVGHAWETPAEGWHNALSGNKKGFKTYLNVVEDARIERCIKSRYPGLRSCFYKAYKELSDKDFFGLSKYNINELPLIDRINLHFKIGPFLAVPFSAEEQFYVKQIENLSSWDDVVRVAKELYGKRIEEMEEEYEQRKGRRMDFGEIQDYEDGDDLDDIEIDYDDEQAPLDDAGGGGSAGSTDFDPKSMTDEEFRKRESELVSDQAKPHRYATLPVIKTEDFIISHKTLYSNTDWDIVDRDYTQDDPSYAMFNVESGSTLYANYKQSNAKFIQYLVKEFELRRNAAQHARAQVAKTGELDIDKVFGYKYKTDLFKRVTVIPGGKNHGMVMFVDWSGSMSDIIKSTIEQTMVLADFCKKVNIPFRVFAFSDHASKMTSERTIECKNKYSRRTNDLALDSNHTYMMELLSNTMTSSQYHYAQKRLLQIGSIFGRTHRRHYVPDGWQLGGTPLNEAIVFANYFIPEFKEAHRLDIVNTIVLTDGEANETEDIIDANGARRHMNSIYGIGYRAQCNTIITDKQTGKTGVAKPGQAVTAALLDLLRNRTETNLIGYYILGSGSKYQINHFINVSGLTGSEDPSNIIHKLKKEKFYAVSTYTYDKYFLVKSDDLNIEDDELEVKSDSSKKDILKSFVQSQKSKVVNRVLLNKFVAEIA